MSCSSTRPCRSPSQLVARSRCQSPASRCRRGKYVKRSFDRNQQYSITAITDGSGAVVERYAYTAYGTPIITDASGTTHTTTAMGNRYTYTGREWDNTLALYHYRSRMYDATSGRFCSRDPIGFEGDSTNISEYVGSNPGRFIDPHGLERAVVRTHFIWPHYFIRVYRNPQCAAQGCRCKYGALNPKGCVDLHFGPIPLYHNKCDDWTEPTQWIMLPSSGCGEVRETIHSTPSEDQKLIDCWTDGGFNTPYIFPVYTCWNATFNYRYYCVEDPYNPARDPEQGPILPVQPSAPSPPDAIAR